MAKKSRHRESQETPNETAEEIYRKEILPHQGGSIGPSPSGNVHDSHIPPAKRG
jgi:hypothetical protein